MWNSVKNKTKALASHGVQRIHAGFVASVYTLAFTAFVLRAPWLHYHLTPQPLWRKIRPRRKQSHAKGVFLGLLFFAGGSIAAFCPFQTSTGHGEALGMWRIGGEHAETLQRRRRKCLWFCQMGTRFTQLPGWNHLQGINRWVDGCLISFFTLLVTGRTSEEQIMHTVFLGASCLCSV